MERREEVKKIAKTDGLVAAMLSKQPLPRMCRIKQKFDDFRIHDVQAEIKKKLRRQGTLDRVKKEQRIAITAGSRGVANIAIIIKTIADEIKRTGGNPFIVPSMGSHGGATAEGQSEILASYNITEETMNCPVLSSMETVRIGVTQESKPVYIDKNAAEADGIVVVGRVKPHAAFHGKYESGLIKMVTIGLGKQLGAEICHADSYKYMEKNITSMAKVALKNCNILFGVALVENAYDETCRIEAIPAEYFFDEEPALLEEARSNMPAILFKKIDVLIVDEIGKDISGDGMDPNITGTFSTPYATGGTNQQRTVVLDISDKSHGNGSGLGMADFSVQRAFNKMDFEVTYPNALTCTVLAPVKLPLIMANDKLAIQAAIKTCNNIDHNNPRVVRIKNSLKIGEICISESLMEEAIENPDIEILGEPEEIVFDENNNLF
jgi:hypothetical protein